MICAGEITWEPENCFVFADGSINDIFKAYNKAHPIQKKRKLSNNGEAPPPSKKRKESAGVTQNTFQKSKSSSQPAPKAARSSHRATRAALSQ